MAATTKKLMPPLKNYNSKITFIIRAAFNMYEGKTNLAQTIFSWKELDNLHKKLLMTYVTI